MRYVVFGVILLLTVVGVVYGVRNNEEPQQVQSEETEEFILKWLKNENGTIATYIYANETEDADLVKGREALAETVGLLMNYALQKKDQVLFNSLYEQLTELFIEKDGFLNWKLTEDGKSEVSSNAFIDDIRVIDALVRANEVWGEGAYLRTAEQLSDYITTYSVNNGIYTDFYERKDEYASENIKLSYIDVKPMDALVDKGLLDKDIVAKTSQVLMDAPLENGFYPLSYNVVKEEYTFAENVNIVDQAILAYHFAQVGERSEEFLAFIKQEMNNLQVVHGMYDLETKEPVVDYESPAIYGYLISYALVIEEDELAEMIYKRLKEFQVTDRKSEYYGGYSITDGNTHIFDNLIPLLAEQELLNN